MESFNRFKTEAENFEQAELDLHRKISENTQAYLKFIFNSLITQTVKEYNQKQKEKLPQIVEINWDIIKDNYFTEYYPANIYLKIKSEDEKEVEFVVHRLQEECPNYTNLNIPPSALWRRDLNERYIDVVAVVFNTLAIFAGSLYRDGIGKVRLDSHQDKEEFWEEVKMRVSDVKENPNMMESAEKVLDMEEVEQALDTVIISDDELFAKE